MEVVHSPVLLNEVLELLAPSDERAVLLDGTLGEGGHSAAFLQSFSSLTVVGLDADESMLERAQARLKPFGGRLQAEHDWFDHYLSTNPLRPHRILLDLGISMVHFRKSGRGFSVTGDEPLDMRLSADLDESAADIINSRDEVTLANILFEYGEERLSRRFARGIVQARPILTTRRLADLIVRLSPPSYRHGRIHPATRTFQALRIAVNDELGRLRRALDAALLRLPSGGRLGVISFHSLEDRIVKHRFRQAANRETGGDAAAGGSFEVLTKKPIVAGEPERAANPASRSAKLRAIHCLEAA